jgi:hypothetical protein
MTHHNIFLFLILILKNNSKFNQQAVGTPNKLKIGVWVNTPMGWNPKPFLSFQKLYHQEMSSRT